MKKLFALLLAALMAFIGSTTLTTNTTAHVGIDLDTPVATKAAEWEAGYASRCRHATAHPTHRTNHAMRRIAMALALPVMLFTGVYTVSYKAKDGLHEKDFDSFSEGRLAFNKIEKAGLNPEIRIKKGEEKTPEQIARESSMNFIQKIHLGTGEVEYIPMPRSSLQRRLKKLGLIPFDSVIKIDAHANELDEDAYAIAQADVDHICAEGYKDAKGCVWMPLLASASDKRKGTFMAVRADLYSEIGSWLCCGLVTSKIKMVVSKFLVYLGLQTSSSRPMMEVFGWTFDFHRIAVIPDFESETTTARDVFFCDEGDHVGLRKDWKEPLNIFDGAAFYFKNVFVNKTFSFRVGPWTKGCCAPLDRYEVKRLYAIKVGGVDAKDRKAQDAWIEEHKSEIVIKTIDGNVPIDAIDLIMTESCWKCKGQYKSVKEWADSCVKHEYEANVCVNEHKPRLKAMPYQQGQLIRGSSIDALAAAAHAGTVVSSWNKAEKAAEVLPGTLGEIARLDNAFMKNDYVQRTLQEMYAKRRNEMVAGKIPNAGYSLFVMPDPVCFIQHMFGWKIESQFAENEIHCSLLKDKQVGILTRNPDTDGFPESVNKKDAAFCAKNVVFINPFCWTPILLRLDYDGDHILIIVEPLLVKLFQKTRAMIGETPFVWNAPAGKKEKIGKAAIAAALKASIAGGKTGIHSDNITKLMNISKEDLVELQEQFGEDVLTELHVIETKKVNVEIDKTKNAAEATKANKRFAKMEKAMKGLKLPRFCRFSKASEAVPATDAKWDKKTYYTGSFLDIYSRTVEKRLPEVLEIKGLENEIFDVYKYMIDPARKTSDGYIGLTGKGIRDEETDTYYNEGLFSNIAFRSSKEWALATSKHADMNKSNKALLRDAALAEIKAFVEAQGGNLDGAYDVITRWVFCGTKGLSKKYADIIYDTYFDIFGEKILSVLCMNLGLVPDNDFDEEEEEEA